MNKKSHVAEFEGEMNRTTSVDIADLVFDWKSSKTNIDEKGAIHKTRYNITKSDANIIAAEEK